MSKSTCRAKDPATCKVHGVPGESQSQQDFRDFMNPKSSKPKREVIAHSFFTKDGTLHVRATSLKNAVKKTYGKAASIRPNRQVPGQFMVVKWNKPYNSYDVLTTGYSEELL
jgi:hypothetical protein